MGLPEPVQGTVEVFTTKATGLQVQLPGWNYPVVCDLTSGRLNYDNYGGSWGKQSELDKFLQFYAVEKAKIEAKKKGHRVTEQTLDNGSIKLTVKVSGGAA